MLKQLSKLINRKDQNVTETITKLKFQPEAHEENLWLQAYNFNTILDIGAHQGETIKKFKKIFPLSTIHSFEPILRNYNKLNEISRSFENCFSYHYALGDENKETTIFVNDFTPSSSLLSIKDKHVEAFPFTQKTKEETIELKRFTDIYEELKIKGPILAKIDTQGFELNVLNGMGDHLNKVDMFIIETSFVELYDSQVLFDQIYSFMKKNQYRYIGAYDQLLDPNNGQILQQDAIFIKE